MSYFKSTAVALTLAILAISISRAEEAPPGAELGDYMTYYYVNKDTATLAKFLEEIESQRILEKNESATAPVTAFLAVVFAEHPGEIRKLITTKTPTGKLKEAIQRALWRAGQAQLIREIFDESPDFATAAPVSLQKLPITNADDPDRMWGAFLASGDTNYVARIIDVLAESRALSGDKRMDVVIRGAAQWSLKSNMLQHELVLRRIRSEAESDTRNPDVRALLKKMLASIPNPSLPHKDGNFSAMLVIMKADALKEFDKPGDEKLQIRHTSKFHRDEPFGIKLVFTGIELSNDLLGHVVYDLKIFDPDGKIYEETELTDLVALHTRVPNRLRIFNNDAVVMIRFEPKDKLGTYRIIARIHDKIGSKSIPLEEEVSLIE